MRPATDWAAAIVDAKSLVVLGILLTIGLVGFLLLRPRAIEGVGGRVLAFLSFFLLPVAIVGGGVTLHLEHATSTEFCLSCHEMEPYGRSLRVDDAEYLAANHFQNNRVPPESACYACHTDYTMFGDARAKMRGLKHVVVHYFGDPPDELSLYEPYRNRECLHCHDGSRIFVESWAHEDDLEVLRTGELSCLDSGCHDVVHATGTLGDVELLPEEGS